jgi:vacuolar-type H+-ATPase subunit H
MTKLTPQLEKEILQLNEERERLMKQAEEYKKEIYSQLKSLNKAEVSNTIQKEQKYSLWDRIMMVLGMK